MNTDRSFLRFCHARRRFNAPLSMDRALALLDSLELGPGQRMLDFGCGTAELLLQACAQQTIVATGIDRDSAALDEARTRQAQRALLGSVRWCESLDALQPDEALQDVLLCIGASAGLGGYQPALEALSARAAPGGRLLVGEIFWRREPPEDYRALLGAEITPHAHEDRIEQGEATGLMLIQAEEASSEEWEYFEAQTLALADEFARMHPEDPNAQQRLLQRRRWWDGYERWGRSTMGFGYYLFKIPAQRLNHSK